MFWDDQWKSGDVYRLVNLLQTQARTASEILEHVPVGIAVVHADGRVTDANRKYASLLGAEALSVSPAVRRTVTDVVTARSARENVPVGSHVASILPFGVDAALVVLRSATPADLLVDMLQAMDSPAYLISHDGAITASNSRFAALMGAASEELLGQRVSDLHEEFLAGHSPESRQSVLRTKRGEVIPVSLKVSRLAGHPSCAWIVVVADACRTPAQETEDDIARSLQAVSGRIAHFMNNWLMIVLNAAESLNRQFGSIEAIRSDLDCITESTTRASQLARDLLTFSSSRLGPTSVVAVDETLEAMIPLLRTLVGQRSLSLKAGAIQARVRVPTGGMETLMSKLVLNAAQATTTDGRICIETSRITPEYKLHQELLEHYGLPAKPHVRIEVIDNGAGIAGEHHKLIFHPFFTTKAGAVGMGLAAADGIVRQSKGAIGFQSRLGEGTRFDVLLPECESST
ncbi:MAG TPA: ATP-binding protein [Bryobacteraceae bacterium]|nr:ATP-binding protein [Bryobacteraceae bacterium]